ncbi:UNVERIFIED_CONTAM: Cysteine-rich receptor-like protein kinase [Sesamum latifolium]|uniref:Cysteine-rich receptor-like protein kinase n=1 Tax=Sesamum latifolium TaxID=2727402 RepID=A0AAW2X2C2_9LAMI
MMKSQTWLALILLILTNLSDFATAQNHWCYNDGNYTANSTYSTNLNTLLSSLSSNMDDSGFYNASQGVAAPDRANALALCRADIQLESCRGCVQNATIQLLNLCPERKHAILWRDVCVLHYSNVSLFGNRAEWPPIMVWVTANVSSPDQFKQSLRTLVDALTLQAASGGSLMKVAAGNHTAPDFQWIYAMLQCTPDISEEDCSGCLTAAAQLIPECCDSKRWATILLPSCNLQYGLDPFYNITRIQEAQTAVSMTSPSPVPAPVLPPPLLAPPGHGNNNTARTVIIIVATVVACLIVAICVGFCLRKRTKKKAVETIPSDEEMSATESLQYDFGKIRAATDDFSDANKLGQGGFGVVYKGKLDNGKEIAVKRLSRRSAQGDVEFKNEVLLVAKLQHRYLVRLLGFALQGTERLLIYEFVQNASLDHFIFGHGNDNTARTVIIIVATVVACLIVAICVGLCLRKRSMKKAVETIPSDEEMSATESLQYDFGKIRAATDDFSDANKLGQGGFGVVYKGKLENGKEIAVKRLSRRSARGDVEFKNEVLLVAKLQHRYLVRLLGFALQGTERVLIYEFVQNASLDHYIFDRIRRFYIDWNKRYKIIGGIARGLLYLHEDSRFRIIHRDLKASNILLDGEMNPKIADFGTASGYMAPEYAKHGQISVKTDVFSFGVLVLEIVSGRKNNSFRDGENAGDMLISFAWRNWHEGTATSIIDPALMSGAASQADMLRCIHIGLLCVQENASVRPTMASVVLMLSSFSTTLPVPSPPAFFMSNSLELRRSLERNPAQCTHSSRNDASISELRPR